MARLEGLCRFPGRGSSPCKDLEAQSAREILEARGGRGGWWLEDLYIPGTGHLASTERALEIFVLEIIGGGGRMG